MNVRMVRPALHAEPKKKKMMMVKYWKVWQKGEKRC
jgi:hypothetical protein